MRILDWNSLSSTERRAALQRPALQDAARVNAAARDIVERVRREGDAALKSFTEQFDGVRLEALAVTTHEFAAAERALSIEQHAAIERAIDNVRRFHAAQCAPPLRVETTPGVICERFSVPIRAVGLYVPAGSAPLPSTAIMLAVPAALAHCPVKPMCTAPGRAGGANPAVLVAARKAGIEQVFKVGGAQAIAAMAYGSESIPKCDKIFGPGNAYVTAAKLLVAQDAGGAALDLPAGPTEVMVIADAEAHAAFVAADLLAQAEHSPEAQALLVTTQPAVAAAVFAEVRRQSARLSRSRILAESIEAMRLIVVDYSANRLRHRQFLCAGTSDPGDRRRAQLVAENQHRGGGVPRTLVARVSGRLLQRPQSHPAHLRLRAFLQRAVARGLSAAHHGPGTQCLGLKELGPTARILAHLKAWMRTLPR